MGDPKMFIKNLILVGAAGLMASQVSVSVAPLSQGTPVRLQASSIEGGWHSGRMHLDDQKCWMVKLDKPTRDNYTMLALIVVTQLQTSKGGTWTPVALGPVLKAQPAVCSEYAAD